VEPVACTRLGLLDLADGRAREGATLLQLVVDLTPDAPSAALARAALVQVGVLVEPTPERLRTLYGEADDRAPPVGAAAWRRQAQRAAALLDREPTFEGAASRYRADDSSGLDALLRMDDPRVVELLAGITENGPHGDVVAALNGLIERVDDARPHAAAALRLLSADRPGRGHVERGELDAVLRALHGGGPRFTRLDRMKAADFAEAWLDWLAPRDGDG
jgi:hypothetical protein